MSGINVRAQIKEDFLIPADKGLSDDWISSLTYRGHPEIWNGRQLKYIGMPVGGIACGQLYIAGDGQLWHWDIFKSNYSREDIRGMGLILDAMTMNGHYTKPVASEGWGSFSQKRKEKEQINKIIVDFGNIRLNVLEIRVDRAKTISSVKVNGKRVSNYEYLEDTGLVKLMLDNIKISEGKNLDIVCEFQRNYY